MTNQKKEELLKAIEEMGKVLTEEGTQAAAHGKQMPNHSFFAKLAQEIFPKAGEDTTLVGLMEDCYAAGYTAAV